MRLRRFPWWLMVALVPVIAGCGGGRNAKAGRVTSVENVAPRYEVRDSRAVRQRVEQQEQLGLAVERMRAADYVAAERMARAVLKAQPSSVDAYTVLAAIQSSAGNAAAAGESYRKAAELEPGRGDLLNNYGAWLCANGHPAEALVWFDRALADAGYGTPAAALANAGGCALQSGQNERAQRDLRRALELDPINAYALESMARSEYRQGRYFEARAFSQRRLAAASATPSVLQLAIQVEERLGDKAAASHYQEQLRKEFPDAVTAPQD